MTSPYICANCSKWYCCKCNGTKRVREEKREQWVCGACLDGDGDDISM